MQRPSVSQSTTRTAVLPAQDMTSIATFAQTCRRPEFQDQEDVSSDMESLVQFAENIDPLSAEIQSRAVDTDAELRCLPYGGARTIS